MSASGGSDKQPLLRDRTPTLNYTKRYDQVSWRSADTDFEVDPSASSADESSRPVVKTSLLHLCTKRQRKIIALVVVIVTFLGIMSGLIYLYYSKPSDIDIEETDTIDTDAGPVSGVIETIKVNGISKKTFVFKSIPYALPPVKELRFLPPVGRNKSNGWKDRYRAIKFKSECVQLSTENKIVGSEDCLFLNVYSPSLNEEKPLPVVVWIHGGSLLVGNGNKPGFSPNPEFVTSMNVVAVSMNYRLNAFGFLTLKELWDEGKSYGNYGIMDQILVLKWVQKNIKNFGGDPNSVTIIGEESGGTSALGTLSSPLSNGLFHNIISMSASPKIEIDYKNASISNVAFLNRTSCKTMTSSKIKECLRNLSIHEIINAVPNDIYPYWSKTFQSSLPENGLEIGAIITVDPIVIPGKINAVSDFSRPGNKVSVLLGSTAQDVGLYPDNTSHFNDSVSLKAFLKQKLNAFFDGLYNFVVEETYADLFSSNMSVSYKFQTLVSDVRLNCPMNDLLNSWLRSKSSNIRVFRYVVSNKPEVSFRNYGVNSFTSWDSLALFGYAIDDYEPADSDRSFQKKLRENFNHFIRYGHMVETDWEIGKTGEFTDSGNVNILAGSYHKQYCPVWRDFTEYAKIN